jgi:hypothetical protein
MFGIAEPSLADRRAREVERKLAAVRRLLDAVGQAAGDPGDGVRAPERDRRQLETAEEPTHRGELALDLSCPPIVERGFCDAEHCFDDRHSHVTACRVNGWTTRHHTPYVR